MIPKENIQSYIPQRPPFVMIDSLISYQNDCFISTFEIQENNLFIEGGIFSAYGMIENIAQTAAAGLRLAEMENKNLTEGVIGSLSNMQLHRCAAVNSEIKTEVRKVIEFGNMYKIKGCCYDGGIKLFECEMNLSSR